MPNVTTFTSSEPYTVYVDESGDHSLTKIDPSYPIFGLGAVLMKNEEHTRAAAALTEWKTAFFGKDVVLHTREIFRSLNDFAELRNAQVRKDFWNELSAQIDGVTFEHIAAVIHKPNHLAKYGNAATDPYHLTLEFIMERIYFEMRDRRSRAGFIAEGRKSHLDLALSAHYKSMMKHGTGFVQPSELQQFLAPDITFQKKHTDAVGLQICDIVLAPVCREVHGLKNTHCVDYAAKFRKRRDGHVDGYGRIVFPK